MLGRAGQLFELCHGPGPPRRESALAFRALGCRLLAAWGAPRARRPVSTDLFRRLIPELVARINWSESVGGARVSRGRSDGWRVCGSDAASGLGAEAIWAPARGPPARAGLAQPRYSGLPRIPSPDRVEGPRRTKSTNFRFNPPLSRPPRLSIHPQGVSVHPLVSWIADRFRGLNCVFYGLMIDGLHH